MALLAGRHELTSIAEYYTHRFCSVLESVSTIIHTALATVPPPPIIVKRDESHMSLSGSSNQPTPHKAKASISRAKLRSGCELARADSRSQRDLQMDKTQHIASNCPILLKNMTGRRPCLSARTP